MSDNKRIPKRPVDKYNGVTYITTNFDECDHDVPIVHTRKKGRWVPYVSTLYIYNNGHWVPYVSYIYYIINLLTLLFRVVHLAIQLI